MTPGLKLYCRTPDSPVHPPAHAPLLSAPLLSSPLAAETQRKVLKYDFLPNLCETISLERLPISARGDCDPTQATSDQVHDFVVCGRVAEVPGAGGDEGSSGGGTDEESGAGTPAAELEQAFGVGGDVLSTGQKGADEVVAAAASNGGGRGSRRGSSRRSSGSSVGGGSGDGAARKKSGSAGAGGKPHVTFRSLFERLQARDEPTPAVLAATATRRSGSPPLSRASSFQEHSSLSSPPLSRSRQGSDASLAGSGGSGRPFVSPGPRGVRRASTAGLGVGVGIGVGGDSAANGERSPSHGDEQAEDFDSRLVGRALRLSMKRKVLAF